MNAREMAAKIIKGQTEADIAFHKSLKLWMKISWGIIGFSVLCAVLALTFTAFAWAVIGFIAIVGNLLLLWFIAECYNSHQCILPKVKEHIDRKKSEVA